MDWFDTPDDEKFRKEIRATIAEHLPAIYTDREARLRRRTIRVWREDFFSEDPERRASAIAWRDAYAELGWTAPGWTREKGGAGLSTVQRRILSEELAAADAPGIGGGSADLFETHGTERHRREQIPRILAGTALFSGGYSEPGSGSDLASLSTTAIRDGDDYIVNGQKIWSSGAHEADLMMVLVRTDPEAPKHRGISMLLVDLKSPGVEVRGLPNITYLHSFNETFFDNVRVPAENLLGAENEGWRVAMSGFEAERSTEYNAVVSRRRLQEPLKFALSEQGRRQSEMGAALRDAVADREIEIEVGEQFTLRLASLNARGEPLGYVPSVNKLHGSHTLQATTQTTMRLLGLYCQLFDPDDPRAPLFASVPYHYLYFISATIGGGTSEIQRNVIATRGLGLPRG